MFGGPGEEAIPDAKEKVGAEVFGPGHGGGIEGPRGEFGGGWGLNCFCVWIGVLGEVAEGVEEGGGEVSPEDDGAGGWGRDAAGCEGDEAGCFVFGELAGRARGGGGDETLWGDS